MNAIGLEENAVAGRKGGGIAGQARKELEERTGQKVVTGGGNVLPSVEGEDSGK